MAMTGEKHGFTLVELLVVIAIIGTLIGLLVL
jgi:prepilin-type N-terminal cleavage/methylation domain-containing protein